MKRFLPQFTVLWILLFTVELTAQGPVRPANGPAANPQAQDPRAFTNQGGMRPAVGAANEGAPEPMLPCPFPQTDPQQQQFLEQLLAEWEGQSSKIERYRCDFERWVYDPVFGPRDPREAKTYAKGKIQYAAPDKGLFKIESIKANVPAAKPGEPAQWVDKTDSEIEHWVCDGTKIFEFSYPKKQLIERMLPKELQGKAIVDGPLPFLFGAKAEKIKARYWLRVVTPADIKGEFWLEAVPKYRRDAQNFKMVHVIIDQKDFLPKALQVFDPAYDPQKRQTRTVFTFNNRDVNFSQGMQFFLGQFFQPKTPLGWKFISEPYIPEPGETAEAEKPASPQRPGASALKLIPFQQRK